MPATCYLGIDVSKGYADFVLLDQNEFVLVKPFRLDDTAKGYAKLRTVLDLQYQHDKELIVYAAVESTGGLENNWLHQLRIMAQTLPVHSARINPRGVAQYVKADLTRTITDSVSAMAIARYQIAHRRTIRYDEAEGMLEKLRPTWTAYCLLKKQKQQVQGNLHPLLYTANPGIMQYCRRGIPPWICAVIERYPTATKLSKAKITTLCKIPFVTEKKAQALITLAQNESGSRCDQATDATISLLVGQIRHIDSLLVALEKVMIAASDSIASVNIITSFQGIGIMSAIGLVMNMPDITDIENSGKLSAYWGLHPVFKQSGDGKSVSRMSKTGRIQPRAILYMVALACLVHNPHIRDLYKRRVSSGMKPMAAIGVCMHKISRMLFGMLKSGKKYDASIDEKNATKPVQKKTVSAEVKQRKNLRRLQVEDPVAPISKREQKKRAALGEPQNVLDVKCEVINQNAVLV